MEKKDSRRAMFSAEEAKANRVEEAWGSLCWVASQKIGNADGLTLGRVTIKKGAFNPRHCHPNCEEALYLLRGRLRHTLGDESFLMEPGDTVTVPVGVFHNAINIGEEDADMIVAFSSGVREFQLEAASEG